MMDFKAMEIMQRLRNPNKGRDNRLVVDTDVANTTPPGGQPPNMPGVPTQGSPSLEALSAFTAPPPQGMDAAQPLEQSFGAQNPATNPVGEPSRLDMILKARGNSKTNFLGG
jgi:hypothetical protein